MVRGEDGLSARHAQEGRVHPLGRNPVRILITTSGRNLAQAARESAWQGSTLWHKYAHASRPV